jgi:hypothetical protein
MKPFSNADSIITLACPPIPNMDILLLIRILIILLKTQN